MNAEPLFANLLSLSFPFGPAEKYTDFGGYPIGYVVDDGEYLCADCVNDPTNPVHMGGDADGWRIEGIEAIEYSEVQPVCAHCGRQL